MHESIDSACREEPVLARANENKSRLEQRVQRQGQRRNQAPATKSQAGMNLAAPAHRNGGRACPVETEAGKLAPLVLPGAQAAADLFLHAHGQTKPTREKTPASSAANKKGEQKYSDLKTATSYLYEK
jgi:hypothetical protein